ncbi:MAG: tRNA epoxyqueuosine(34) reductase QueG [Saprospiraceae bacterium]|nr:tRNA epoxyqueuosine(34) reductase QueG [Saprospiraceae bacterium]
MDRQERSRILKEEAYRLGFNFVGIAKAEFMEPEAQRLEEWLSKGYHGRMAYMENHFEKRVDPTKLVPGAKSVVSLVYNYFPEQQQTPDSPKLARYAYGEDYHFVIKRKLKTLLKILQEKIGAIEGRVFVDSAPVLERDWAYRAGNGWIGKNTLLIHPKQGSFFFLAEMILDIEFDFDHPIKDYCGTCRACIDACPTEAIAENGYVLDGSKCISYLTIELKEEIPTEFKGKMENWVFGCDICQEVCPWNRFSKAHQESDFEPREGLLAMEKKEWEEITEEVFQKLFKKSAVKRTKFKGFKRNLNFLKKN